MKIWSRPKGSCLLDVLREVGDMISSSRIWIPHHWVVRANCNIHCWGILLRVKGSVGLWRLTKNALLTRMHSDSLIGLMRMNINRCYWLVVLLESIEVIANDVAITMTNLALVSRITTSSMAIARTRVANSTTIETTTTNVMIGGSIGVFNHVELWLSWCIIWLCRFREITLRPLLVDNAFEFMIHKQLA